MTGPDEPTREQEVVEQPTVSTAPPPARTRRWWSGIPSHLGRARTSTVVLGVLFLVLFALYLQVRPAPEGTAPADRDTPVTEPATTTAGTTPAPPTTTTPPAPTTSVAPTTPETTSPTGSTTGSPSTTEPSTTEPSTTLPTTETTTEVPLPTTSSPTG